MITKCIVCNKWVDHDGTVTLIMHVRSAQGKSRLEQRFCSDDHVTEFLSEYRMVYRPEIVQLVWELK